MLFFKAKFLALIREKRKRQTVRLWTRPRVKVGQQAYVPGLGRVMITRVDKLSSLATLTAADAHADGFPTRAAMLREIRHLYANAKGIRSVYRVKFKWNQDQANPQMPPKTTKNRPPAHRRAPPVLRRNTGPLKQRRAELHAFVMRLGARVKING